MQVLHSRNKWYVFFVGLCTMLSKFSLPTIYQLIFMSHCVIHILISTSRFRTWKSPGLVARAAMAPRVCWETLTCVHVHRMSVYVLLYTCRFVISCRQSWQSLMSVSALPYNNYMFCVFWADVRALRLSVFLNTCFAHVVNVVMRSLNVNAFWE